MASTLGGGHYGRGLDPQALGEIGERDDVVGEPAMGRWRCSGRWSGETPSLIGFTA
jgi:hypothetical protein